MLGVLYFYWKPRVAMMPTLLLLVATEVANDNKVGISNKVGIMTTHGFQCFSKTIKIWTTLSTLRISLGKDTDILPNIAE